VAGFSRITINEAAIREFVTGGGGPVVSMIDGYTRLTANAARAYAPVRTGELRGSIGSEVDVAGLMVTGRVFATAKHAPFVHSGHGVITPKKGRFLVWADQSGQLVFARRVRAVDGNPFLYRALNDTVPWPVTRNDG
jgi:hypothetical protein